MQYRTVNNLESNGLLLTISIRRCQRGKMLKARKDSGSGIVIGHNLGVLKGRKDTSTKRALSQQKRMGYVYNWRAFHNLQLQNSHYVLRSPSKVLFHGGEEHRSNLHTCSNSTNLQLCELEIYLTSPSQGFPVWEIEKKEKRILFTTWKT